MISYSIYFSLFLPRNNKLGLDAISGNGVLEQLVEEVHTFAPITSAPICNLQVQGISVGTSHTAILTGIYLVLLKYKSFI